MGVVVGTRVSRFGALVLEEINRTSGAKATNACRCSGDSMVKAHCSLNHRTIQLAKQSFLVLLVPVLVSSISLLVDVEFFGYKNKRENRFCELLENKQNQSIAAAAFSSGFFEEKRSTPSSKS